MSLHLFSLATDGSTASSRGRRLFLIVASIFMLAGSLLAGEPPTTYVELLNRQAERTLWFGKRYTYTFQCERLTKGLVTEHCYPWMLQGTRVLEIGVPEPGSVVVPIRVTQTTPGTHASGDRGKEPIVFWEASNGRQTRLFSRFYVGDNCDAIPEHFGFVTSGPNPKFIDVDPFFISLNSCGSGLSGVRGGSPRRFDENEFENRSLSLTTLEVPDFGKCFVRGDGRSFGLVLSGPEFLMLGGSPTGEAGSFRYKVDAITEIDGIRYPKSGHYESPSQFSSFELLDVEELTSTTASDDWFYDWPTGTVVFDYETGVTKRIPFEAAELAEIKRQMRENCSPDLMVDQKPWLLWANMALIACITGYALFHWRTRFAN